MDYLEYKWGLRKGGLGKSRRDYIDFVVNGQPLSEILNIVEFDFVGLFGWSDVPDAYELSLLYQLKGIKDSQLDSKRIMVYGCPECADIGCGSITCKLEEKSDRIIWRDFGYENGVDAIDLSGFEKIPTYEFVKEDYISVFNQVEEEIRNKKK